MLEEVSKWNTVAVVRGLSATLTVQGFKCAGAFEFLRYSSPSDWALQDFQKEPSLWLKRHRLHLLARRSQLVALYSLPRAVTIQS